MANTFSNRVVDNRNSLTEDIVNAPSPNAFKNRFRARTPKQAQPILLRTRGNCKRRKNPKPECIRRGLIRCLHRYIRYIYTPDHQCLLSVLNTPGNVVRGSKNYMLMKALREVPVMIYRPLTDCQNLLISQRENRQ